ncbi:MAG: anthranilate phosphoribosyltransferase [Candidatus Anaerobiospirillum merdipullorum]|uniref:Anthranilate phosphoribosyltransferase n=1 Tax=Candidatus Anaerobiospirillum merdipullorum TaxID=2838450 RepID=A0A9E2NTU2_9GAMM|nr:anthranilate phosphoribosyltransferase [Candidatus Anaerobiospirillum merdipullorum]
MLGQLNKLYAGKSLSLEESQEIFASIFAGKLSDIELSSLVTALKIKGESESEVAGAALAMLDKASPFKRPDSLVGEIVGTGGDGFNTINISTITAIMAASLGLTIAKHGNRAVSSKTGASDLLKALGYNIEADSETLSHCLSQEGFAFMFAQKFHQAMRYAAPVRQSLKTRTIFNLLGPLTNPAHPDYELMGVYDKDLLVMMAQTLRLTGVKRALCVNGSGLDEIANFGTTYYSHLHDDGRVTTGVLTKESFGIHQDYRVEDLIGGSPEENAVTARAILSGKGNDAQNSAIAVNLSALLSLAGKCEDFKSGFDMGMDALKSGIGIQKLERLVKASNEHVHDTEAA